MTYDLIIVGAGPAGLTAAIYAARYNLNALVIGKLPGGVANEAFKVCNFPGQNEIPGVKLMMGMMGHMKELGVELKMEEVTDISREDIFKVATKNGEYFGKKIILANGTKRRLLGVDREDEFKGKGVVYCATCDAAFYKGKTASVVGGGDAALTAAILLGKFADKVYLITRGDSFTDAEQAWVSEVNASEKIEIIFNANAIELLGEEKLSGIKLDTGKTLDVDGLFVEIGSTANVKLAEKLEVELVGGRIKVDENQKTNIEGVYAAGDITNTVMRQIITACSDGAKAAQSAYREISK